MSVICKLWLNSPCYKNPWCNNPHHCNNKNCKWTKKNKWTFSWKSIFKKCYKLTKWDNVTNFNDPLYYSKDTSEQIKWKSVLEQHNVGKRNDVFSRKKFLYCLFPSLHFHHFWRDVGNLKFTVDYVV